MADYRRDPIYFIDRSWLSVSLVFYTEVDAFPYCWGIRRLAWPVADRWAFDTPWFSLFVEFWALRSLLRWRV